MKMKLVGIVGLMVASLCYAQEGNFQPASTNVLDAQYHTSIACA